MWLVAASLAHWFLYSLAGVIVLFLLRGIRYIPNTKVGLVEKRASRKGSGAETTPNPPTPRSAAAEAVRSRIE